MLQGIYSAITIFSFSFPVTPFPSEEKDWRFVKFFMYTQSLDRFLLFYYSLTYFGKKLKGQRVTILPEKSTVFACGVFGDDDEEEITSRISGIGLKRGFLEAISLSPYKDFCTFLLLLLFPEPGSFTFWRELKKPHRIHA